MLFRSPWKIPDKNRLYSLASGAPIHPEVEVDVLQAEAAGRAAKEQFIHKRFVSKKKGFFDRLKKLNLKTMDHCSKKVKLTSAQGKVDIDSTNSLIAITYFIKKIKSGHCVNASLISSYSIAALYVPGAEQLRLPVAL